MRSRVLLAALLTLCSPAIAGDEATVLAGNKLRDAVSGKTVYLMTPIGAEIPIRYMPNGMIRGTISASLAALGGESVKSDTGRWWVTNEHLCQQWKNWSASRSHCYRFRTTGNSVEWRRNDGETGTARIATY
jgi:hypothetical protein